jgi:hypothetical protein
MEINIDKSEVMRVSRRKESLRVKVGNSNKENRECGDWKWSQTGMLHVIYIILTVRRIFNEGSIS